MKPKLAKTIKTFLLLITIGLLSLSLIFPSSALAQITIEAENADHIVNGTNDGDLFSHSISSNGDLNNDGYDDLAVGAYGFEAGAYSGRAYIFFGSSSWDASIDAENADVVIEGNGDDGVGVSVSIEGDLNHDGYDDLAVGADWASDEGSLRGSAYIFFGSSSLSSANAEEADVIIRGTNNGDYFSNSISSAGDVNNDGYDDLVVGAFYAGRGQAYIFFGSSSWDASIDAENADVIIYGTNNGDIFSNFISSAGDINHDGYDDVLVAAHGAEDEGADRGRAYIFFGSSSWDASIDAENADVVLNGTDNTDHFGVSLSLAGDINHDGYDDVLVGAYRAEDEGADRGRAYIFFGSSSWDSSIDAENADVVLNGTNDGDNFGDFICSAGDVNNDGYNDVIVGTHGASDEGTDRGRAYIFFGSSSWDSSIDAENADVVLNGTNNDDYFSALDYDQGGGYGNSLALTGDINHDGWQEVVVGAIYASDKGSDDGQAYIFDLNYADPSISLGNDIYATNFKNPDILSTALQTYPYNLGGIQWSFDRDLPGSWHGCTSQDGEYNSTQEQGNCNLHVSDLPEGPTTAYFRSHDQNSVYLPSRYWAQDDFIVDYTNPLDFSLLEP